MFLCICTAMRKSLSCQCYSMIYFSCALTRSDEKEIGWVLPAAELVVDFWWDCESVWNMRRGWLDRLSTSIRKCWAASDSSLFADDSFVVIQATLSKSQDYAASYKWYCAAQGSIGGYLDFSRSKLVLCLFEYLSVFVGTWVPLRYFDGLLSKVRLSWVFWKVTGYLW